MIHGEECWPDQGRIAPCQAACPIHMDVPGYIMALAQGKYSEGVAIVRETNPFPSICGRVCPHPCEEACNRAVVDEPLAIARSASMRSPMANLLSLWNEPETSGWR
jgi:NADPH-dependent glutamate synthase beta subunit-like oxidoreductase